MLEEHPESIRPVVQVETTLGVFSRQDVLKKVEFCAHIEAHPVFVVEVDGHDVPDAGDAVLRFKLAVERVVGVDSYLLVLRFWMHLYIVASLFLELLLAGTVYFTS